jgi:hypothetical protein
MVASTHHSTQLPCSASSTLPGPHIAFFLHKFEILYMTLKLNACIFTTFTREVVRVRRTKAECMSQIEVHV